MGIRYEKTRDHIFKGRIEIRIQRERSRVARE
jgi:hypothetical protein